jgi:hypothetical protein
MNMRIIKITNEQETIANNQGGMRNLFANNKGGLVTYLQTTKED